MEGSKIKIDVRSLIQIDPILEKFECSVCMSHYNEPHISKCGHSFCKVSEHHIQDCIFECLNMKKQCPSCNTDLQVNEVYRNYQLEDLLNLIVAEKKRESDNYVNDLADKVMDPAEDVDKNPIETVFKLNLRNGLLQFEKYYEQL